MAARKAPTCHRNTVITLSRCFRYEKCSAYTLIEIALVLVIVGLLFGMIRPAYIHIYDEKKSVESAEEIRKMGLKIDQFFKENGHYPDSLGELYDPVPSDPWGNPYQYLNIKNNPVKSKGKVRKDKNLVPINSDYDLYSMGPDGKSVSPLTANASKDDIVRGRNGMFVGAATDY